MTQDPVQRHYRHLDELRRLLARMPAGPGRERLEARYAEVKASHEAMIEEYAARQPKSGPKSHGV